MEFVKHFQTVPIDRHWLARRVQDIEPLGVDQSRRIHPSAGPGADRSIALWYEIVKLTEEEIELLWPTARIKHWPAADGLPEEEERFWPITCGRHLGYPHYRQCSRKLGYANIDDYGQFAAIPTSHRQPRGGGGGGCWSAPLPGQLDVRGRWQVRCLCGAEYVIDSPHVAKALLQKVGTGSQSGPVRIVAGVDF